ncbi:MAG: SAM-dependent methyltransferase [Psychroflexus sp.]|nr:SAM-dependent methyltransferase [Psychroflexus sp.]MDN6310137.1 SAM-dependent methyltransferase [Psychroflexus sp.]
MNEPTSTGKLFLIPNLLGDQAPLEVLPLSIRKVIESIDHYIVENEKVARHFIKKISPKKSQNKLHIQKLNKFTSELEIPDFLNSCIEGHDVAIISDAGCPGVADPGAVIVDLAHQKKIDVIPLVGPSSILLGLMASGLNGQSFSFTGYLPIDKNERKKSLKKLESRSQKENQTQIFIETPYRNNQLIDDMCRTLNPMTKLCVAVDLTTDNEFIRTKIIKDWCNEKIDIHKRPAIYLILAS